MSFYMSHIYLEAKEQLLASLKADPVFSEGLFYLHGVYPPDIETKYKIAFPTNGLIVLREVCDPTPLDGEDNEARVHQQNQEPVLSWQKSKGPTNLKVMMPSPIPTLAFGKILINDRHNPHPPPEFLQFLKHISFTLDISVAFYHHYSAYEDELANSEYSWIFGREETVLIRHIDEPYKTVQYTSGVEPRTINSERVGYKQPVLEFIMNKFGATLHRFDERRPYFYNFKWNDYRV